MAVDGPVQHVQELHAESAVFGELFSRPRVVEKGADTTQTQHNILRSLR